MSHGLSSDELVLQGRIEAVHIPSLNTAPRARCVQSFLCQSWSRLRLGSSVWGIWAACMRRDSVKRAGGRHPCSLLETTTRCSLLTRYVRLGFFFHIFHSSKDDSECIWLEHGCSRYGFIILMLPSVSAAVTDVKTSLPYIFLV